MNPTHSSSHPEPRGFYKHFEAFKQYRNYLIVPVIVCTALAIGYCLVTAKEWSATQTVFVRDDISGNFIKPGRFDSLDAMKTVQETIQDTAKSNLVLLQVLEEVGPESGSPSSSWPSLESVDDLRDNLSMSAPNGAEFGQTEVIHVTVKAKSVDRAKKLARRISEVVQEKFNELRRINAKSIEDELSHSVANANKNVEEISSKISKIEQSVGTDLGELRNLTNPIGGSTGLSTTFKELKTELRGADRIYQTLMVQRNQLLEAQKDPRSLITTSSELLVAQPSLKKLKDGLIDAQLAKAKILGQFDDFHPKAKNAIEAEAVVRKQIRGEIATTLQGLGNQVDTAKARVDKLNENIEAIRTRMNHLASVRVDYENLSIQLKQANAVRTKNKTQYDEAVNGRAATEGSTIVNLVSEPEAGSRPVGLAKKYVLLAGILGGFGIGIGLVIFISAPDVVPHQANQHVPTQTIIREVQVPQPTQPEPGYPSRTAQAAPPNVAPQPQWAVEPTTVNQSDLKENFVNEVLAETTSEVQTIEETVAVSAEPVEPISVTPTTVEQTPSETVTVSSQTAAVTVDEPTETAAAIAATSTTEEVQVESTENQVVAPILQSVAQSFNQSVPEPIEVKTREPSDDPQPEAPTSTLEDSLESKVEELIEENVQDRESKPQFPADDPVIRTELLSILRDVCQQEAENES